MPKLNPLVSSLSFPPIPIVQKAARAYDGRLGPLIDLAQAVPGYPPHTDLLAWLSETAGNPALLGYGDIEGEAVLRVAYSQWQSEIYGASLGPDRVHITSGCNQAFIAAALAVARPGDSIVLIEPYYFNHDTSLSMLGIHRKSVRADANTGFIPSIGAIEDVIDQGVRALALVTPNNPTGAVYSPEDLDALYDLCVRHDLYLIVDETYRDFLDADRPPHNLFRKLDWEDHLVSLYSFSKSFCIPGHRLGALTAGSRMIDAVAKIMDNLQICAPRPAQHALARAITDLGSWRAETVREIEHRRKAMVAAFDGLKTWRLAAIGAYFAYVEHPFEEGTAEDVAAKLARERGVSCLPGSFFGSDEDRYLRFAFANADAERISHLRERLV
ncbi:MAG: aminotransferase [Pseudomonadota bacterium]